MNYSKMNIIRVKHEDVFQAVKHLEFLFNDLTKDVFLKARNVSMLVADGKTYEESVEICYPDAYEKKFIVENAKLFDDCYDVIEKGGFNVEPVVNAKGLVEINLVSIKG